MLKTAPPMFILAILAFGGGGIKRVIGGGGPLGLGDPFMLNGGWRGGGRVRLRLPRVIRT